MLAGVDEAGRGCLAGPVVAGAVILPNFYDLPGLNDSKKLTADRRAVLEPAIKAQAVAWGLGVVWPAEIDRINILQSTFKAMARAVAALKTRPTGLSVDGNKIIPARYLGSHSVTQKAVVDGDSLIPAISAASILAKTFRDRLMEHLDRRYPGYGLALHKGYGTAVHMEAIVKLGPCRQHRLTFRGVLPEKPSARQEQACLPGL
ncbi:ribonuclease HII [Fundidesulfovibrio terrae]|uniref:ribonuclease HII n=1 Tax=Fundidesulfovibrio terrae TaxID=2922866 RepID=UPI001FAEECA1|nr:ribonuclease HII [Fundidesulfovibrio terrae]